MSAPDFFSYVPHHPETWSHQFATVKNDQPEFLNGRFEVPAIPAGTRVKIVMVSRFGDFGVTRDLQRGTQYERRIEEADLTDWGVTA